MKPDFGKLILEYWLHFLLAALSTSLTYMVLNLKKKFIRFQERERATENGVQALLRNEIIKTYNHFINQEFMPVHEYDNISYLYSQYKNLGGNGTIQKLMEEIEEMPVHETSKRVKGEKV